MGIKWGELMNRYDRTEYQKLFTARATKLKNYAVQLKYVKNIAY